jgi:hypothetical protein
MTRRLRLLLLAVASLGALALSSSALAAFVPQLAVSNRPMGANATGTTIFRITIARTDDALLKATIYVPTGYEASLAQSVGATIGTAEAQVEVQRPIAGAVLPVNGNIVTEDPAAHAATVANVRCTGGGAHAAVWMLVLQASGQELRVPAYVDRTAGAEAALGAYKIQVCLPSPHIPETAGGATFGAKLIRAQLNLNEVFRAPATSGEYVWRLVATPWAAPATPNSSATIEARATIGLPASLSVSASSRRRTLTITGRLVEGSAGVSGSNVVLRVGNKAHRVRTNATGRYTLRVRFRRAGTTTVRATAAVGIRSGTCSGPLPNIPAGCGSHTRAFFTATSRTIRPRIR